MNGTNEICEFEDFEFEEIDLQQAEAAVNDSSFTSSNQNRLNSGSDIYTKFGFVCNSLPKSDSEEFVDGKSDFIFQQIEIDYYFGSDNHLNSTLKSTTTNISVENEKSVHSGHGPVFRLYGTTGKGNSVLLHAYGYRPHFYLELPNNFNEKFLQNLQTLLEQLLKKNCPNAHINNDTPNIILDFELTKKSTILGYNYNSLHNFVKITITSPKIIPTVRRLFDSGCTVNVPGYGDVYFKCSFNSNIDFETHFMSDALLHGCNWIELKAKEYTIKSNKTSHCKFEIECFWDHIISHSPEEDEWCHIAPLKILSFDIECAGRKGIFPVPEVDPVIQIAASVSVYGSTDATYQAIFTLNTCASVVDVDIFSYQTETELLQAWRDFMIQIDADIITGYNIINFDIPYLVNRAKNLGVFIFRFLGRIRDESSEIQTTTFQNKAYGKRENKFTNISGRVQIDVLQKLLRDYKLRSYSLNSVCFHFLRQQKEDIHYSNITDLQNGDEYTRRRLAIYCLKDSLLPLSLIDKLMMLENLVEMARVTGVPITYLLTRGQQIKVMSQILRKSASENYLIPSVKVSVGDEYEGATVIEPARGYYDKPISTLDFNSLYPSIMICHNLCYTTLVSAEQAQKIFDKSKLTETPSGHFFIKSSEKKGILPDILQNLLSTRNRVKIALKHETDLFKKKVLDSRQLALKITANSVYGFTGAQVGKLPCLEISASTTSFGREMIFFTKSLVEKQFTVENGYDCDAKVIYGDTDSVMIKFGSETVRECVDRGKEAAHFISAKFPKPINLEFEKVYYPYLLINKKKYAGLVYTNSENYSHIDCKGIESVRRDNCPLVANLVCSCLNKILIERKPLEALQYAKDVISDLLCNRVDISQLVITKELTRTSSEYVGKQAHVELSERMKKRDPGSAPKLGDRVPYVIIAGSKLDKAYEKAEDPIYVLDNNIPIDTKYYLENQLKKPLLRLFEPILKEKALNELFYGSHTLKKSFVTSTSGLLTKFTKKKVSCVGCKSSLDENRKRKHMESDEGTAIFDICKNALCDHCLPHASEIYQREISQLSSYENNFSKLWTECQKCQGSVLDEVICSNRDCLIFYMRKKIQKDLDQQRKLVKRFG